MSGELVIRRALPFLLVPLGMLACGLAAAPWLRTFPSSVLAVPLFGAAALSVLVPVVVIGIGVRRLWLTAAIDVILFVFFTDLAVLHEPLGLTDLYVGLVHGPSQILTFALPLVSPRTLLVAPVTLCWIGGAVLGECIGRGWHSVVPYATLIATFGLAYAGSVRGVTTAADGRRYDAVLAGALLLTLLLMRAIEAWIEQDLDSEVTQPDGRLPRRGLAVGVLVALLVAAAAATAVQAPVFSGPPVSPNRAPPLDRGQPLSPVAFVAGLRPRDPAAAGSPLFSLRVDRSAPGYVALADVDSYDGDGWSFQRSFRPSGGVIPGESDPGLRPRSGPVRQQYTITRGAVANSPWMPFLYRPQDVSGMSVDVDAASGMVVPSGSLRAGTRYSVTSRAPDAGFAGLGRSASVATSAPTSYTFLPGSVASSLDTVVRSFENETGTPSSSAIPFLQALARDLTRNYALSGGPVRSSGSPAHAVPSATATRPTPSGRPSTAPAPSTSPAPSTPSDSGAVRGRSGGTGYANVLAAILGPARSATPEQYATLMALVAREVGVPSRLVTGFRIGNGTGRLQPDHTYRVTTAEAWTWVEIPVQGRGWVVLDPSPTRYSSRQQPRTSAPARPSPSPTPTITPNGLATQSDAGHAVAPRSSVPGERGTAAVPVLLIVLAAIVLVLVTLLAALLARKRLRARRRRRSGDPRRRLVGAWQESLDVLVEAGLDDPANLTSAEIAAATEQRFGDEPAVQARYLGDRANAAIFSPTSWVDQADADAAWQAQAVLRRSVRRRLTLRQRVRAQLRYRRPRRARALVGPSSWSAPARTRAGGRRGRHVVRTRDGRSGHH